VQTGHHGTTPTLLGDRLLVFILEYSWNILNKFLKINLEKSEIFITLLCYGLHKKIAKNMSFTKKLKSIYKSFYCLKTLVIIFQSAFGYLSFIRLISYTNTLKITLCKSNSIWSFLFLKKMLNTQNQALVTIACVHISVIALLHSM